MHTESYSILDLRKYLVTSRLHNISKNRRGYCAFQLPVCHCVRDDFRDFQASQWMFGVNIYASQGFLVVNVFILS